MDLGAVGGVTGEVSIPCARRVRERAAALPGVARAARPDGWPGHPRRSQTEAGEGGRGRQALAREGFVWGAVGGTPAPPPEPPPRTRAAGGRRRLGDRLGGGDAEAGVEPGHLVDPVAELGGHLRGLARGGRDVQVGLVQGERLDQRGQRACEREGPGSRPGEDGGEVHGQHDGGRAEPDRPRRPAASRSGPRSGAPHRRRPRPRPERSVRPRPPRRSPGARAARAAAAAPPTRRRRRGRGG